MAWIQERKKKNGKKTYTALIRVTGYPTMSATFDKLTDARDWVAENETPMKRGKHIKDVEAKKHTLADLVDRYVSNELKRRKSDHQKFEMHLTWWKKELGSYLLSGITPMLISERRDKLQKEPFKYKMDKEGNKKPVYRSNATVNRYMASLSIAYTFAANEWGWVDENPVRKVKKRTESRGRVRFLSEDEQKALLKACGEVNCPYLPIIVILALSTGGRFSEIMNLKWQDVDFERKVITFMDTKNGDIRSVALSKYPYDVLKEHSKIRQLKSSYVFPRKDGKAPLDLRKKWDKAVEKSKIKNFHFHDLRHTAASNLAMSGATLVEISDILGHKTMQMVKRYSHLTQKHTAEVLERMNEKQFANV